MSQMILGIPAGKSLEEPTMALLEEANIEIRREHPRSCVAGVIGFSGIDKAIFVKPSQIPTLVADGTLALGLTGEDMIIENGVDVVRLATLNYSRATAGGTRGVLFARSDGQRDILVRSRKRNQTPMVVVSEYPKATEGFFLSQGIPVHVVPCSGSAEALVVMGKYPYGVALVETGTSLRVNRLKEVAEIFSSKTVLIANTQVLASNHDFNASARFLARLLTGVVEARQKVFIVMNAPIMAIDAIRGILPALTSPTIQPLADPAYCSISAVVPIEGINGLKQKLLNLGATGIVELDHSSIV